MEERLGGGSTRVSDRWTVVAMRVSGDRGKQVRKGVGGQREMETEKGTEAFCC